MFSEDGNSSRRAKTPGFTIARTPLEKCYGRSLS